MTAGSERALCAAIAITIGIAATTVVAQPSKVSVAATAEFDKGRTLMKSRRYAEACAAFERSNKLEPLPGTLYNLAACYVQIGKLATAWAAFRDLSGRDPNRARRKAAGREAAALASRLPRLIVKATRASGLVVTVDGVDVTSLIGTDTPIDLGPHTVEGKIASDATAGTFSRKIEIAEEGKTITVDVVLARPEPVTPRHDPAPRQDRQEPQPVAAPTPVRPSTEERPIIVATTPAPATTRRTRKAAIFGLAGGAALVGGVAFSLLASNKWDEARQLCGSDLMCDTPAQLDEGNALVDAARVRSYVATGLVAGGLVLTATAVYFMVSRPDRARHTAWRLAPAVGSGQVGLAIGGGF